jgi:hypothetical protein
VEELEMIAIIKGTVSLIIANTLLSGTLMGDHGPSGAERVEITVLAAGPNSSADGADFVVCRTQKELDEAILRFGITQKKSITADFGKGVVCLGFLGKRPTAGYGLEAKAAYYLPPGGTSSDPWGQDVVPLLSGDGLNPDNVPMAQLQEGDAVVILQAKCPPEGAMLAQVITSPFIIIYLRVPNPENVYVSMIGCGGGQ